MRERDRDRKGRRETEREKGNDRVRDKKRKREIDRDSGRERGKGRMMFSVVEKATCHLTEWFVSSETHRYD